MYDRCEYYVTTLQNLRSVGLTIRALFVIQTFLFITTMGSYPINL